MELFLLSVIALLTYAWFRALANDGGRDYYHRRTYPPQRQQKYTINLYPKRRLTAVK